MSGHSKWNNIKRKKEKTDGARAKVFTKIGREISVAVRMGGPNPASNSKLADLIAKAKRMSVPNDNIQRIIKKAEGGDKTEYEAITYEGYGPGGVAVMVETLTDNRNRTAADLRHYFDKNGGNLGAMGCVGFLFNQKGVIDISLEDMSASSCSLLRVVRWIASPPKKAKRCKAAKFASWYTPRTARRTSSVRSWRCCSPRACSAAASA